MMATASQPAAELSKEASKTLHPQVLWAQRKPTVFLTVEIPDAKDINLKLEEDSLEFSALSNGNHYAFSLTFPEKVNKENSKWSADRTVNILLEKKEEKRWQSITTEKKAHWLKCNWDKWLDTDEEEEKAKSSFDNFGDMDFSKYGDFAGGAGGTGFGGPGAFDDEDDEDEEPKVDDTDNSSDEEVKETAAPQVGAETTSSDCSSPAAV